MRDKRFPGSPWGPWLPLYTTLPPTLETTISVWLEISSNIFKFLEQSTKSCTTMILIFIVWQQIVIVWSKFGLRSSFISLLFLFGFGIYFWKDTQLSGLLCLWQCFYIQHFCFKDYNLVQSTLSVLHDLNNWSIYPTVISFYHFLLLGVPPDSERWSKSFQVIGFVENWLGCCCWQADWSSSKYCCIRRKQMLQKRQI